MLDPARSVQGVVVGGGGGGGGGGEGADEEDSPFLFCCPHVSQYLLSRTLYC